MAFNRLARYSACVAFVGVLVWVLFSVLRVNTTTVALAMLLLVLGIASRWGLGEAVLTSLLCGFGFNFFFLPPIRKLTIASPQDWAALAAFLISALVGSRLSTQAKARAEEASARRSEIERLYRLSRAMLMDETTELVSIALNPIRDIFELSQIAFYDRESHEVIGSGQGALDAVQLEAVAASDEAFTGEAFAILPVRVGTRVIGSLGLAGKTLTAPERESIANLLGISYEKTRAIEKAAAAEAARQGERLKTFLLDGIAHDLKTPLTAIKTCVSTLITIPPRTEEKRAELLTIINEEADHLHRTITEAIQLARIESQKVTLDRRPVLVASVLGTLLEQTADRQRFVMNVPADLAVQADPDLLGQALRQLIENARKYSPRNSSIEVSAQREGGGVTVRVMDRGPGISPRELERIFDKFFRGTRGRAGADGTGMGLPIAKGIIEAHGGTIWAENRPGGGATFVVRLFDLANSAAYREGTDAFG